MNSLLYNRDAHENQSRHDLQPIETAEAWIEATALLRGVAPVTHNRSHYSGVNGFGVIQSPSDR